MVSYHNKSFPAPLKVAWPSRHHVQYFLYQNTLGCINEPTLWPLTSFSDFSSDLSVALSGFLDFGRALSNIPKLVPAQCVDGLDSKSKLGEKFVDTTYSCGIIVLL